MGPLGTGDGDCYDDEGGGDDQELGFHISDNDDA